MTRTGWTPPRVAELVALWLDNQSARTIALKLGITRNAVLGKLYRLPLSGKTPEQIRESMSRGAVRQAWTAEREAILREMWAQNKSSSAIARELGGITRKGVEGKAERLGLIKREHNFWRRKERKERPQQGRRERKPRRDTNGGAPRIRKRPSPSLGFIAPVDSLNVSLWDLERHHCREITGYGDSGLALFCGEDKSAPTSFCPYHRSLNYTPVPARPRKVSWLFARAA